MAWQGYGMALHGRGKAWHVMVWVWYGMVLHGRDMVWHGLVGYGMAL